MTCLAVVAGCGDGDEPASEVKAVSSEAPSAMAGFDERQGTLGAAAAATIAAAISGCAVANPNADYLGCGTKARLVEVDPNVSAVTITSRPPSVEQVQVAIDEDGMGWAIQVVVEDTDADKLFLVATYDLDADATRKHCDSEPFDLAALEDAEDCSLSYWTE
ncbi:MAG: hypothetical protein JWO69_1805 [Thermoleophilia bacterium]|jgi:hypothetical protein|nr:hypothetical protein [Thermoleophilia bacterium]